MTPMTDDYKEEKEGQLHREWAKDFNIDACQT